MSNFERYLLKLSKEYNIDERKLLIDWKSFNDENEYVETVKYNKCIYQYMRGELNGKICGCSVRKKNSFYCSKHRPYEDREVKKKKKGVVNVVIEMKKDDKQNKPEEVKNELKNEVKEENKKPKKTIIRLHPVVNKFVHSLTGLIFFSKNEQVVYARLNESDEIVPLTDEDVEECKKYSFKYDRTKI